YYPIVMLFHERSLLVPLIRFAVGLATLVLGAFPVFGQTAVLTRSNDNRRSGANTNEKSLTPAAVRQALSKRRRLKFDADPRLGAQPLYMPSIKLRDGTSHSVVYLCTMANQVWAFDVDTGALLWKQSIAPPNHKPIQPGPDPRRPPPATQIDM